MAREPRKESSTGIYHVMARGVNQKEIFHKEGDFMRYLCLLKKYSDRFDAKIYHYCIMSNHTHFIVHTQDIKSLSRLGHCVHRQYAGYYCKKYDWSEQVFRRNFLSIPIEDDAYFLECGRYIERNPLEANLVKNPEDYPFSSYRFYAKRRPDPLLTESSLYESLGKNNRERVAAYKLYVCHERKRTQIKELALPF
jgi:putative transposase